jgi:hypothetical protein
MAVPVSRFGPLCDGSRAAGNSEVIAKLGKGGSVATVKSADGKRRLSTIGADDERLGNNANGWESHVFRSRWRKSCHKAWAGISEIASHSPFDEHILRRYVFAFGLRGKRAVTCEAIWRLGEASETTFSHTIASASPLEVSRNRTV